YSHEQTRPRGCALTSAHDGRRDGFPAARPARRASPALEINHSLEAAPDHALGVEGHRCRIHHLGEALILHHFRIYAVAVGARLVDDVGEEDGLAGLLLDAARKGRSLSPRDVIGDAFAKLQRTVLAPDLACLCRHTAVRRELLLWNRHEKSIDVTHPTAPWVDVKGASMSATRPIRGVEM